MIVTARVVLESITSHDRREIEISNSYISIEEIYVTKLLQFY